MSKRTSRRSRHSIETSEFGPGVNKTKRSDLPQEFEESFTVRKPLGLRIHKNSLRVTYVETNSALINRVFAGDKIVAIDGQPIRDTQQLNKALNGKQPSVVIKLRHAYFSFCQYNGATVERLQLEKDVFKSTGRAIDLFTIYLKIPRDLDETQRILRWAIRYDARERVQIAQIESLGLAAVHMKSGDVIREVNDHPIASKAMLRHWICEAVEQGQIIQLSIERLVGSDDLMRDQIEAPADVLEIAQRQIQEIKAKTAKTAPNVLVGGRGSRTSSKSSTHSSLRLVDKPTEMEIQADHDASKLKSCKMAKH